MKTILLALVLLLANPVYSQRWFAINDSTSYEFNNVKITVGRHHVYLNQNENLTLIRDFSTNNSQISEDYIRDFDFIDADSWYVLVGSRYIGQETELYRTDDSGATWELIIPSLPNVSEFIDNTANSINQVQIIGNRIYLFDTYYQSRVVYSDDGGQHWVLWFQSFWSHWYQIYPCGNDLYIHGLPGDGFAAYMTQIPTSYMGSQNIQTAAPIGNCHNDGPPVCNRAPANSSVPEICNYFKSFFATTICPTLAIDEANFSQIKLVPNPVQNQLSIEGIDAVDPFQVTIYNTLGQQVISTSNQTQIDLAGLPTGIYQVSIRQNEKSIFRKLLKQ